MALIVASVGLTMKNRSRGKNEILICFWRVLKLSSRVDTDVLMEVAYSCNFLAVSDSSTCPDIGTN